MMLNILDYDVITASDGLAAIETFESRCEEIDMVMPGMSGDEVYTRLRELQPDVKVLVAGGYSMRSLHNAPFCPIPASDSNFNPPEADKSSKYLMYSCG